MAPNHRSVLGPSARRATRSARAGIAIAALLGALAVPAAAQSPSMMPGPFASASPAGATHPAPAIPLLVPSAGFAVSIPGDWIVLEFGRDPEADLAAFAERHPELESHVRAFLAQGPMAVIAIAPAGEGDPFPATFGAFRGRNMGMSADAMLDLTVSTLPRMPGVHGEITAEPMTISGEDGFAASYGWTIAVGDGPPIPVHVDQFTIVTPDVVLAFSVTDDQPAPDGNRTLADSFVLLP